MRRSLLLAALVPLFAACVPISSSDLKTSAIDATYLLTSDGSGKTHVHGTLTTSGRAQGLTAVDPSVFLDGNDSLTVTDGQSTQQLVRHLAPAESDQTLEYDAEVPTDASGALVTISLMRTRDASAPKSTVVLPGKFSASLAPAGTTFSRANDDLRVTWDLPATDDEWMSLDVSSPCAGTRVDIPTGATEVTVPRGSITQPYNATTDSCDATVTLVRWRAGNVDPAYGTGSQIAASRSVVFTIRTVP